MKVITKVLDIEMQPSQNGDMAVITLKSPGDREAMTVRMFPKDVEDGKHHVFETHQGRQVVVDLDVDEYKGKIQHRLGYNFQCTSFEGYIRNEHEKLEGKSGPHGAVTPQKKAG